MKNKGFVSLFLVSCIGFLALILSTNSIVRGWSGATSATELRAVDQLRFNALSCVGILKLKIFLHESVAEGEYVLQSGVCDIESVRMSADTITANVSSKNSDFSVSFAVEIDAQSLEVRSASER